MTNTNPVRHVGRTARPRRPEVGAVTAETAVVLPLLAVCALAAAWLVWLASWQVSVESAARETARAAARGEADAVPLGRRAAPEGARIKVTDVGDLVEVEVSVRAPGVGLLRGLAPTLTGHAVALQERP